MCTVSGVIMGASLGAQAFGAFKERGAAGDEAAAYETAAQGHLVEGMGAQLQAKAYRLSGEADALAGEAAARAYDLNAELRDIEAKRTEELGAIEVGDIRQRNAQALGQQKVDLAGAGRDVSSGSSLALAFESAREGERDVLKSRTETMLKSEALRFEGQLLRTQAADTRVGAEYARRGGEIAARGAELKVKGASLSAQGARQTGAGVLKAADGKAFSSAANILTRGGNMYGLLT